MDSSTKKLLNGSAVYFVGTALTQLVSLMLMRFVTGNITPDEYGFFNLVTTISNLAVPFVTLQIADAVYRFVLKSQNEEERKSYFAVCFVVTVLSIVLTIGIIYGISSWIVPIPHATLVGLYVIANILQTIYHKIVRCMNRNTVFVTGNLIKTTVFLLLEILLISTLNLGVEALLLAHILSICVMLVYSELKVHALKIFDVRALNFAAFTKMIRFSAPLIPNAAFWWLTSSVNNLIVSAKLGMDINGIYSVSGKFSSVLNMVTSVLNMSWQDTAVSEYGKENFGTFLTQTFNSFVKLIFSFVATLLPFIAIILPYMIDPTYYDAIPYTPFLMLAAATSFMSGFMAQIFTGRGKTTPILITSFFGMFTNIVVIFLLIESIGLWAAVFGSLASDCVLLGTRTFMARKEFAKGVDCVGILIVAVMLTVSIVCYLKGSTIINLIWLAASAMITLILNRVFIKNMLSLLFGKFKRKKDSV